MAIFQRPIHNIAPKHMHSDYVGRFAPSPSGPLHMGSLVCALASYLDAKAHNGLWRLRIDDIDPIREIHGAKDQIMTCLHAHHLHWDGDTLSQSDNATRYLSSLKTIQGIGLCYRCDCTRKRLKTLSSGYDGLCRNRSLGEKTPASIRLDLAKASRHLGTSLETRLYDLVQGEITVDLSAYGDFVIHRKDGLFAYQLASSCDDIDHGITRVIRGYDLLSSSASQSWVIQLLGHSPPEYAHIPVLTDGRGAKLSKQNHAPAISNQHAATNLHTACKLLGISLSNPKTPMDILDEATEKWHLKNVPKVSYVHALNTL